MNSKKICIIGLFFIFMVSFITHNMYDWFPSIVTFMFFPVNESIWEHQKMIFMSYLIWGLVEYYLLKKNDLYSRNVALGTVVSSLFNIVLFLFVYVPVYSAYGHDLFTTLVIYFITIAISQYLNCIILNSNKYYAILNKFSLFLIPIIWLVFIYLSFNPLLYDLLFRSP